VEILQAADAKVVRPDPISERRASVHLLGTCRMGNDPQRFVTNRFGQTHDVPNLYVCDASVFTNSTDKTTTLSIMAFTLRTCDRIIESFRDGVRQSA
jgi:choline dehydrogenase-like flavoprotein